MDYFYRGLPVIGTKSELARAIEKYKYDKFKKEDNKRRSQLEEVLYDRNRRKKEVSGVLISVLYKIQHIR